MSLLGGHLGDRVSALLDGQLSEAETERAWAHANECHACRELVEREGWIKRRLAGLTYDPAAASDGLKGSLMGAAHCEPGSFFGPEHQRRNVALATIGGTAVGAAVMGVLALGAAPASAPTIERPTTASTWTSPSATPVVDARRH
ncbi:anti-sigma factor family protein [Nocardioides sp. Kera G14]|uniref:anti-sigma factor family protein n=1 Tax=Nocardioides sp. Kera G14 TaxID=2884264 RepID=UPI001D11333D|nr:zf-HC2 domain-containing protein [Nocardioides sp. Kera G14]UDY22828.1 zf-HC2 domain-containing protein [Nocardioides sp. Kera G14]